MKLQTPVTLDGAPVSVSYSDKIVVLGSCFADEIGARLAAAGFRVLTNPFGTLYNPVSIGNAIARLGTGALFGPEDVVEMGRPAEGGRTRGVFGQAPRLLVLVPYVVRAGDGGGVFGEREPVIDRGGGILEGVQPRDHHAGHGVGVSVRWGRRFGWSFHRRDGGELSEAAGGGV